MSFLKISDPAKRDAIVKEYLDLKKNIRDNLLSERTGGLELQTDLSKFYRPITETQKATAREITEGLKTIKEGIEKLPQAMQPIGEATGEAPKEEEDDELIGEIAKKYLNKPNRDEIFGVRKIGRHHYIGDKHVITKDDDIIVDNDRFLGTRGLWELITYTNLDKSDYDKMDYKDYEKLMIKTNALHRNYDSNNHNPRSNRGDKWKYILSPIWEKYKKKEGYEGNNQRKDGGWRRWTEDLKQAGDRVEGQKESTEDREDRQNTVRLGRCNSQRRGRADLGPKR